MSKPIVQKNTIFPLGIDFGTSNSGISRYSKNFMKNGPESINFPITGNVLYPSFAFIDEKQEQILTGVAAYNKRFIEPEKVIASVKRKIKLDQIYSLGGRFYKNVDIASAIISDLIKEIKLSDPHISPKVIVITVPYSFGENENVLIKQAATQAIEKELGSGIQIFLLPEPIAASLACIYQLGEQLITNNIFLIYDIGGGTLDFTLAKITNTPDAFYYEVLANEGISNFGGDDIDNLIFDYVIRHEGLDFSHLTPRQKAINEVRLKNEAIEAKHQLSFATEYNYVCSNLISAKNSIVEIPLSRDTLESLISGQKDSSRNMLNEFSECIEKLYAKANINSDRVHRTVPVGGTSLMPIFRNYINDRHKNAQEFNQVNSIDNFTLVSNGACIYGAMKSDEICKTSYHPFNCHNSIEKFVTRIPHSLYIRKFDGKLELLISANAVSPIKVKRTYFPSRLATDGQTIELVSVELFQAQGESRKLGNNIGMIDFSDYIIYTHGRSLKEIAINLTFEATDTLVNIHCHIPKGNIHSLDIQFSQTICLS